MMFQDRSNQNLSLSKRFDGFDVLRQTRPILAQRFEDYCLNRSATSACAVGDHPLVFDFCADFVTGRLLSRISNTDVGRLVNEIVGIYERQSDHTYLMLALTYHPEKEQFVCPMLSQQCCESFNHWQNIRMREIGEYFDEAIAMVASFEFNQNPEYQPIMKFRPLFLPAAAYQAYKQALDIGHQIKLIRERTNGSPVNDIPFGSVIVAALLDEALSRENGIVSGISGLKVPEEEEGEYSLGLVSTICPPSRNEDNSSFIVSGFTEEKVHRFEVYNDYYGVLTVNWLGDDGDKFG